CALPISYWPCLNDINEVILEERTLIYPNPTSGIFTIQFQEPLEDLQIEVYNAVGKLVLTNQMAGKHNSVINLSNYSNGIYYIRLMSGSTSVTKKLNLTK